MPQGVDGGDWDAGNRSCWRPVDFEIACPADRLHVAVQPRLAAPRLKWGPCSVDAPGCLETDFTEWKTLYQPSSSIDTYRISVVASGDGYRVGIRMWGVSAVNGWVDIRSVVYDEAGWPVVVWRVGDDVLRCVPYWPIVTPSGRIWLGAQGTSGTVVTGDARAVVSTCDSFDVGGLQVYAGSDDLLVSRDLTGSVLTFYDALSGKMDVEGSLDGVEPTLHLPSAVNADGAFTVGSTDVNHINGYVWRRDTQKLEMLVRPPEGQVVPAIGTDGETLVWIQGGVPDWGGEETPHVFDPFLWSSPYAITEDSVVPTKRRPVDLELGTDLIAHDGMMAYVQYMERRVHVYRLSDMHHWTYVLPPSNWGVWVAHVDQREVWTAGMHSVVRQRLDALGEGDPAP